MPPFASTALSLRSFTTTLSIPSQTTAKPKLHASSSKFLIVELSGKQDSVTFRFFAEESKRKEARKGCRALKGKDNRRKEEGGESSMQAAENKCPVLIKRQVKNSDKKETEEEK